MSTHEEARTTQAPVGITRVRTQPVRARAKATRPHRTAAMHPIHEPGQLSTVFG
jgi:hypothetical protein